MGRETETPPPATHRPTTSHLDLSDGGCCGEPPRDWLGITYMVFFVLGTGTLFPWNVLITETAYFDARFHVPPMNQLVADNFETCIAVAFQLPNFIALGLFVQFGLEHALSSRVQILMPLASSLLLLGMQAVLTQHLEVSGEAMAGVTMGSAAVLGATSSVLNAGCFGLVSCMPPLYAQACMTGQALAGLAVAVASFVTIWSAGAGEDSLRDMQAGAFRYFCTAVGNIALGVAGYLLLQFLPFFRYHHAQQHLAHHEAAEGLEGLESGLLDPLLPPDPQDAAAAVRTSLELADPPSPPPEPKELGKIPHEAKCAVRLYRGALVFNFLVTLTLFPGLTSMTTSVHPASANRLTTDLFKPMSYVLFNFGDVAGRVVAGWWPRSKPRPAYVVAGSAARALFVPCILLCKIDPPGASEGWGLPLVFAHDIFPHVFVLLLGLTGGFLGAVCMMHAPAFLAPPYRKTEGAKMSLALSAGCTAGSFLSMVALSMAGIQKAQASS